MKSSMVTTEASAISTNRLASNPGESPGLRPLKKEIDYTKSLFNENEDVPYAFQVDPHDDKRMADHKFDYRRRDMYVMCAKNRIVILPDWRIKSNSQIPQIGLYTGELNT